MSRVNWSDMLGNLPDDLNLALSIAGVEFDFEWVESAVPVGQQAYLRITNTGGKFVIVNFRELQTDQERVFFRIYTDVTSATDNGGPLALNNRRGDAQLTSTTVAQPVTEPVFNASSRILNKPIFGQPNEGNQPRTGDLRGASGVRVLPPGFDVLLEADNQSDNPVYFYAQFKQFEVKASTMPDPTEI